MLVILSFGVMGFSAEELQYVDYIEQCWMSIFEDNVSVNFESLGTVGAGAWFRDRGGLMERNGDD